MIIVVQFLSPVQLFQTPWTAAPQAPLSSTISQSWLKFMSVESVILPNHCILCCSEQMHLYLHKKQHTFGYIWFTMTFASATPTPSILQCIEFTLIGQNSRKHWVSLTVCLIDYWVQIIHGRTLLGTLCVSFPGLLKCHTEISDSQV